MDHTIDPVSSSFTFLWISSNNASENSISLSPTEPVVNWTVDYRRGPEQSGRGRHAAGTARAQEDPSHSKRGQEVCAASSQVLPKMRLTPARSQIYHAASARLPCGRLRCRNTRRSDRSALSIPPLTAHMANNGGKRPCRAALYLLRLSLLSIRCTRRLVAAIGHPWLF